MVKEWTSILCWYIPYLDGMSEADSTPTFVWPREASCNKLQHLTPDSTCLSALLSHPRGRLRGPVTSRGCFGMTGSESDYVRGTVEHQEGEQD